MIRILMHSYVQLSMRFLWEFDGRTPSTSRWFNVTFSFKSNEDFLKLFQFLCTCKLYVQEDFQRLSLSQYLLIIFTSSVCCAHTLKCHRLSGVWAVYVHCTCQKQSDVWALYMHCMSQKLLGEWALCVYSTCLMN